MTNEIMVEFRLKGPIGNRLTKRGNEVGKNQPGELCLMRVSQMLCLFPAHFQIRTTENGWTVEVYEEDWPKVEKAFRAAYLGGKVSAAEWASEPDGR
jgi:hypothetical protein